jgi:hypothetical protein
MVPVPHLPAFNVDAARVLLAGFLAGAAGGLAMTGLLLLALVRNPGARDRLPAEMRFTTIGILAANALLFAWTLVGLVLGAVFLHATQPAFSLGVAAGVGGLLGGAVFVRRRLTWPMWSTALVAALAFAVLLPALAARG